MKLFIDDIRNAPDDKWTVARTVSEAIRALHHFEFKEISLDHDISHQVTIGDLSRPYPCPEDFATVAMYIAQKYKGNPEKPVITLHTANPLGALKMSEILAGFKIIEKRSEAANRLEMELH